MMECREGNYNGITYRLYMSETISISASAAAIFSAEEGWGRPPKRKDMVAEECGLDLDVW